MGGGGLLAPKMFFGKFAPATGGGLLAPQIHFWEFVPAIWVGAQAREGHFQGGGSVHKVGGVTSRGGGYGASRPGLE